MLSGIYYYGSDRTLAFAEVFSTHYKHSGFKSITAQCLNTSVKKYESIPTPNTVFLRSPSYKGKCAYILQMNIS